MPWFTWLGLMAAIGCALHWSRRAMANLSEEGRKHRFRVWFLGAYAGRRYFTEEGWYYKRLAVWGSLAIWLFTIILAFVFQPSPSR